MRYFTIEELCQTSHNVANVPDEKSRLHMVLFIENCLDPFRESWTAHCASRNLGNPRIIVSSGYRSPELNALVKGSATSAHCAGYAADLIPANGKMDEFLEFARHWSKVYRCDQIINEKNLSGSRWLHIGWKNREGRQRGQLLKTVNGGKTYELW